MSNHKWNSKALREHIYRQGHNDSDLLSQAIRSVDRTIQIFHFHAYAAHDALKGFVHDGEPATQDHLELVFGVSEHQERYAHAKLASEAHIIGTLYSARSLYDIFSHVVNGLLLASRFSIKNCNIHKVREALPAGTLRSELDELNNSYWFKYVQGFMNTAKHRHLVTHSLNISFVDNIAGIQIGAFQYEDEEYAQRSATDVLHGAFEVKNKIVDCGRALNAACAITE